MAPAFEKAAGHKLVIFPDTSGRTRERILKEQGDVGIISTPLLKELEPTGRIVAGSATVVAKTSAGIAVREGQAREIRTPEQMKAALVAAKAVAAVDPQRGSFLGTHLLDIAGKLGIGAEVKAKLKLYSGGITVGEAIAKGEADIGIGFIPELASIKGVAVTGPLPPEYDYSSLSTVVLLAGSPQHDAGKALTDFLRSPEARKVILARRMEPM